MADPVGYTRLPCGDRGCRKRAAFFGRFAGGMCLEHARVFAARWGDESFHHTDRERLRGAPAVRPVRLEPHP